LEQATGIAKMPKNETNLTPQVLCNSLEKGTGPWSFAGVKTQKRPGFPRENKAVLKMIKSRQLWLRVRYKLLQLKGNF